MPSAGTALVRGKGIDIAIEQISDIKPINCSQLYRGCETKSWSYIFFYKFNLWYNLVTYINKYIIANLIVINFEW